MSRDVGCPVPAVRDVPQVPEASAEGPARRGCRSSYRTGQIDEKVRTQWQGRMGSRAAVALYVLAMIVVVVGVDLLFFRHQFWEWVMVNVGIVLVSAAFYLRLLKRP